MLNFTVFICKIKVSKDLRFRVLLSWIQWLSPYCKTTNWGMNWKSDHYVKEFGPEVHFPERDEEGPLLYHFGGMQGHIFLQRPNPQVLRVSSLEHALLSSQDQKMDICGAKPSPWMTQHPLCPTKCKVSQNKHVTSYKPSRISKLGKLKFLLLVLIGIDDVLPHFYSITVEFDVCKDRHSRKF